MKKYAIGALVLVIVVGVFLFAQEGKTPSPAPAPEGEQPALTEGLMAPTPPASEPTTPPPTPTSNNGAPAVGLGIRQVATDTNWKISLRLDPSWTATKSGDSMSIVASDASFRVNQDMPIAEPELVKFTTKKRTIAGIVVDVRIYEEPNETYALYEFFELPLGNDTYYFKAKTTIKDDPDLAEFYAGITIK